MCCRQAPLRVDGTADSCSEEVQDQTKHQLSSQKKRKFNAPGPQVKVMKKVRFAAPHGENTEKDKEAKSASEPVKHNEQSASEPVEHNEQSASELVQHEQKSVSEPFEHDEQSASGPLEHEEKSVIEPVEHEEKSVIEPVEHEETYVSEEKSVSEPFEHDEQSASGPLEHVEKSGSELVEHEEKSVIEPVEHEEKSVIEPVEHDEPSVSELVEHEEPSVSEVAEHEEKSVSEPVQHEKRYRSHTISSLNKRKLTPADTERVVKKLRFTPGATPCHSAGRGHVRCEQLQCHGKLSVSEAAKQATVGEITTEENEATSVSEPVDHEETYVSEEKSVSEPFEHDEQSASGPLEHEEKSVSELVEHEEKSVIEPVEHEEKSVIEPVEHEEKSVSEPFEHDEQSASGPLELVEKSGSEVVEHEEKSVSEPVQREKRYRSHTISSLNKRKVTPADTERVVKKLRFTPGATPCHSAGRGHVRCEQLQCHGKLSVSEAAKQATVGEITTEENEATSVSEPVDHEEKSVSEPVEHQKSVSEPVEHDEQSASGPVEHEEKSVSEQVVHEEKSVSEPVQREKRYRSHTISSLNKRKRTPADTERVVKKLRFTPGATPCHSAGRGHVRCEQLQCHGKLSVSEAAKQATVGEITTEENEATSVSEPVDHEEKSASEPVEHQKSMSEPIQREKRYRSHTISSLNKRKLTPADSEKVVKKSRFTPGAAPCHSAGRGHIRCEQLQCHGKQSGSEAAKQATMGKLIKETN